MKCKYCEYDATWLNPYTNTYMCNNHALEKFLKLKKELNDDNIETLKDLFLRVIESDPKLQDVVLNTKTGEVTNNAYTS